MIKLIFPPLLAKKIDSQEETPYGMAVITSFLKKSGVIVNQQDISNALKIDEKIKFRILDSSSLTSYLIKGKNIKKIDRIADQFLKQIDVNNAKIVGFSIMSYSQFISALMMAKKIKQNFKDLPVVFGGCYITLVGFEYFKNLPYVDYMVVGSGEKPLRKLYSYINGRSISLEQIEGLIYRDNGRIIKNKRSELDIRYEAVPDFEGISLIRYRVLVDGIKKTPIPYRISKGCSMMCTFCTHRAIDNFQVKPIDKVIKDLLYLSKKYRTNFFNFCDSNLNSNPQLLYDICERLIAEKIDIKWKSFANSKTMTTDLLLKMKKAGCYELMWGIESGSDRILKMLNKGFNKDKAREIVDYSCHIGIRNQLSFIIGYIFERPSDLDKTINFILRFKDNPFIVNIKFFPFILEYNSYAFHNQKTLGIKNVKTNFAKFSIIRSSLRFDEIGGLNFREKLKQQRKYCNILMFKTAKLKDLK